MAGNPRETDGIRVFVHTAVDGYAWQDVPPALAQSLQACLDAAGTFPGGSAARGPQAAGGVIRCSVSGVGGTAVYRYHRRIAGDFRGRDSHYVAFAFFPAGVGAFDLRKVWNAPAMRVPADGGFGALRLLPGEWEAAQDALSTGPDRDPVLKSEAFSFVGPDAPERVSEAFQGGAYGAGALKCAVFESKDGALGAECVYEVFPEIVAEGEARAAFQGVPPYSVSAKRAALNAWKSAVDALQAKAARLSSLPGMKRIADAASGAFAAASASCSWMAHASSGGVSFEAAPPPAGAYRVHSRPNARPYARPEPQPRGGEDSRAPDPSPGRRSFPSLVLQFCAAFAGVFAVLAVAAWLFLKEDGGDGPSGSSGSFASTKSSGGIGSIGHPPAKTVLGEAKPPDEPQEDAKPQPAETGPEEANPPDEPQEDAGHPPAKTVPGEAKPPDEPQEDAGHPPAETGPEAANPSGEPQEDAGPPPAETGPGEANPPDGPQEDASHQSAESWREGDRPQVGKSVTDEIEEEAERRKAEAVARLQAAARRNKANAAPSVPPAPSEKPAPSAPSGKPVPPAPSASTAPSGNSGRAERTESVAAATASPTPVKMPSRKISEKEIMTLRGDAEDAVETLGPLAHPSFDKPFLKRYRDLVQDLRLDRDAADYSEPWRAYSSVTNECAPILAQLERVRSLQKNIRRSDVPKETIRHYDTGISQAESVERFIRGKPDNSYGREHHLKLLSASFQNLEKVQAAIDRRKNAEKKRKDERIRQEEAAKNRRRRRESIEDAVDELRNAIYDYCRDAKLDRGDSRFVRDGFAGSKPFRQIGIWLAEMDRRTPEHAPDECLDHAEDWKNRAEQFVWQNIDAVIEEVGNGRKENVKFP